MGVRFAWRSLSLIAILAACGSTQPVADADSACPAPDVSTQGWERIDLGPFSVLLPSGFEHVDVEPVDSRVGAFRSASDSMRVSYDYGWYSSDLPADPGRLTERTRCADSIGGKRVTVVIGELVHPVGTGRHVVAGAWRNVEKGDPPVHLTILSAAHDSTQISTLLGMLYSVEFR